MSFLAKIQNQINRIYTNFLEKLSALKKQQQKIIDTFKLEQIRKKLKNA